MNKVVVTSGLESLRHQSISDKTEKAMTTAMEKAENGSMLPAHLQGGKKASLGNVDSSDLIMPRVKLLQSTSPELDTFEKAKKGAFWHTMADETLGTTIKFVPIVIRKSAVLWAPRGDDRGILARSMDCKTWDTLDEFVVKPKKAGGKSVTWSTKPGNGSVKESGLLEFGSEIPDDKNSAPAAALQYNMLFWFPDFQDYSPAVVLNTRSQVKKAKGLISRIEMKPVDHFLQMYEMSVIKESNDAGEEFFNYSYIAAGYVDAEQAEITKMLHDRFGGADFRANDEDDSDSDAKGHKGPGSSEGVGSANF